MTGLINEDNLSNERLVTAICLIMILEHKKLGLEDVINATGMQFDQIRSSLQNLVNLRLVKVIPTSHSIPEFQLLDELEAQKYLKVLGVEGPEKTLDTETL